jgi:agmatinase
MKVLNRAGNFLGLRKEYSGYENSGIIILPVSFAGTHARGIYRAGPAEIIKASRRIESFDEEQNRDISIEKGIATLAFSDFANFDTSKSFDKLFKIAAGIIDGGKFIAAIGSGRSIAYPLIKAHHERYTGLSILHIDAHSGFKEKVGNKGSAHRSIMRSLEGLGDSIVQLGIRSQSKDEYEFIKTIGVRSFYAREIRMGMYGDGWQEMVAGILSKDVYITIDLDAFDPSQLPAVLMPEPGGLFWDETLNLLKIIGLDKNIVGFDISGLAPSGSVPTSNLVTAKLLYKILNYSFSGK